METYFREKSERLIIKGQTLSLISPIVMGILNLTPDSFADGGKYTTIDLACKRVSEMNQEGATIIDVGGESTRPGAEPVSDEEEFKRVVPVVEELIKQFPKKLFSIDTTKLKTAKACLKAGAHIINDVSGLQLHPEFVDLCEEHDAGLILMHSKGNPKNMQNAPFYEDVIKEIKSFFFYQLQLTSERLLNRVVIDPGFGFSKTAVHNLTISHYLSELTQFGCPLLVGASRKSIIGQILDGKPAQDRLIGTIAFHYDALTKGAKILRVHDVKEAVESIAVFNAIQKKTV